MLSIPFFPTEQERFFSGQFDKAIQNIESLEFLPEEAHLTLALFYYLRGQKESFLTSLQKIQTYPELRNTLFNNFSIKSFEFSQARPEWIQSHGKYKSNDKILKSVITAFQEIRAFERVEPLSGSVPLTKKGHFFTLPVEFHQGTLTGVFDTGASFFLCLAPDVLEREMSLDNAYEIAALTIEAPIGDYPARTAYLKKIQLGGNLLKNIPCLSFPLTAINEVSPTNIAFILGGSWSPLSYSLDFEQEQLNLNLLRTQEHSTQMKTVLPYLCDADQKILSPIVLNGVKGLALWDTGTTSDFLISHRFLSTQFTREQLTNLETPPSDNTLANLISGPEISLNIGKKTITLPYSIASTHVDDISDALEIPLLCNIGAGIHQHLIRLNIHPQNQELEIYWQPLS